MRNNKYDVRLPTLYLLALAGLVGCSDQLATYPIEGRVLFKNGSPVHVGTVELKSREHGIQARGSINNDGSFTLTTYSQDDGAVAGVHDCVISQFVVTENLANFRPSTIGVIHRRYNSYATSGLTVEIQPNGKNIVTLEVDGIQKNTPDSNKEHEH